MVVFNQLPTRYSEGTASVAANATTVTGNGTNWTVLQPGDLFGVHKGLAVPIASIGTDGLTLTLAYPWPGVAQTNAAYCVQLVPRSVGVQEATRQLLLMLANGRIDDFVNLAAAADKLPYFDGPDSMALADFKSIGRDIASSNNSSEVRSLLGLEIGTTSGTVAAGDDERIIYAMQPDTGVFTQTPVSSIPMYNDGDVKLQRIQRLAVGLAAWQNEGNQPGTVTNDMTENSVRPAMGSAATLLAYSQIGHIAIIGASRDSDNSVSGSMGSIGICGIGISNSSNKGSEAGYFEAKNFANGSGVIGIEIDVWSEDATHTAVPSILLPVSNGPRFSSGLHLAAGGENTGAPITSAISIIDNGSKWKIGTIIKQNSITSTIWYGKSFLLASAYAYDHDNVWFYLSSDKPSRRDSGYGSSFYKSNATNDLIGSIAKHAGDDAIAFFGNSDTPVFAFYSGNQIAFFNKNVPVGQQTLSANATDLASTIALANSLKATLQAYGLAA